MISSRKNKRDGNTYFFVRYLRPDGRVKQEKVPPTAAGRLPTKQDAKDFLTKRKAEVLSGTWQDPDAAPAPGSDPGLTFADFTDRFLREHPGKRRSNHYPSNVRELVKHFGERHVRDITRADLDAYRVLISTTARRGRRLSKKAARVVGDTHGKRPPLSSTTVLKRLRALHRIFRVAVRWGVVDSNPAADLEKPSAANGRLRYLERQELELLEVAAPPWLRPMLRLAVATGMRLSEIALLRWEDLDFRAGMIHVPQDTKTGTRVIPMAKEAMAVLEEQRERRKLVGRQVGQLSPFVLVHDNGATYTSEYERRRISEVTRASARAAGLGSGIGFHTLRHTAASWMVSRGVALYDVQKVLGHSTPTLTQRYAHLAPATLRRATDALDAVLSEKSDRSMTSHDADAASSS